MFAIVSKHLFWWPVTVRLPHPTKAGAFEDHTFEMQFEALPLGRAKAIDDARAKLPAAERDPLDFIVEISKGWRDVVDADGEAVPFSRDAFQAQLQFAWFRNAILDAYQSALAGQAARLGN